MSSEDNKPSAILPPLETTPLQPAKKLKKLSTRETRFTRALMTSKNTAEAAEKAGYLDPTTTAPRLLKREHVLREIDRLLTEKFPDHDAVFVKILKRQMDRALDGSMADRDVQSLLAFVSQLKGFAAPTQVQKLTARLTLPGG